MSDSAAVDAAVAAAHERWGRIDVLVNNAGHRRGEGLPRDRGRELGRRSSRTNLRGAFLMSQRVARVQVAAGGGAIVHIASIDASGGDGPYASYNASKAGLLGLNRTMALELGPHGIRVNCVSPGFTHTEMTEVGVPPGMMDYLVQPLRPRPPAPARAPGGDRLGVRVPRLRRRVGDHGHRPHGRLRSDRQLVHPRVDPGRWLSCRVDGGEVAGWRSVVLENDELRVVVLPDKGAEIHQIVDLAVGHRGPLRGAVGAPSRPARRPCPGAASDAFMWNYAGGWQELFPSVNAACSYRGRRDPVPRRGRVAALGARGARGRRGEAPGAVLDPVAPDRRSCLERVLRLRAGEATLVIEETVRQRVGAGCPLRLGASLRRRAAVPRGRLPARDPRPHDRHVARALGARDGAARARPSRALALRAAARRRDRRSPRRPGRRDREPRRPLRDRARGRLARGLESAARARRSGWSGITRCSAGSSSGNPTAVPWRQPLAGSYALGIEPWTSMLNLEEAVAAGVAVELAAGTRCDDLQARLLSGSKLPRRRRRDGNS